MPMSGCREAAEHAHSRQPVHRSGSILDMNPTTGQMPEQSWADQPRGRWSWRSWLGVVTAWLAGVVCVMLVAFLVAAATYDSNTTEPGQPLDGQGTILLVFTGLVVVPAVALWWTHNRYWYSFAGGLIAPWVALMFFFVFGDDGWPTAEELDRRADRLVASGTPAYYLGDNPRGNALVDIYRNGKSGAHDVTVEYDVHCQGENGCTADISVHTRSISPQYLQGRRCERLDPMLGVPAVRLGNQSLTLFTGHSMISLSDNESDNALEGELELAPMLRAFGDSGPSAALPAPEPAVLRSVEELCGAMP